MAERPDPMGRLASWLTDGRMPSDLSPAEHELWTAYATGAMVDLTGRGDRTVRASVLDRLLLGGAKPLSGHVPAVRLRGAQITGRLDLSGGRVECELRLERCELAAGPTFANAQTRQLRFQECTMPGFDGGGLRCDGYLSLSGSVITGTVRLPRAQLLGGFRMNGTTIAVPGGEALFSGGLIVEVGFFAREADITGEVRLVGARMNGGMFMEGATLRNPGQIALDAQNIVVTDALECSRGFSCEGRINMRGARVTGTLSFSRAVLRGPSPSDVLVHLGHTQIDELILRTDEKIGGPVTLAYSRIRVLRDSKDSWPDEVWIHDLLYDSLLGDREMRPEDRLDWVNRDRRFHLQPYEQLADWYRRSGRDDLARESQLAKLRKRRSSLGPAWRAGGYLLDWAVGYGYRPWRAALWSALLLAVGTVVFSLVPPHLLRQPQDVPEFHAFAYTLDLLMPIPLFGQRDHWNPVGWTQWLAYGYIVAGWILVTALIAGATRVLRPN